MGKHLEVSTPLSVSFIRLLLNLSNNTATNLISCDLFFPSDNIEKTAQHLDGIKSKNKNNQTIIYINLTRGRARSHFTILLYYLGDFRPPLGTFVLYHSLGVLSTPIFLFFLTVISCIVDNDGLLAKPTYITAVEVINFAISCPFLELSHKPLAVNLNGSLQPQMRRTIQTPVFHLCHNRLIV